MSPQKPTLVFFFVTLTALGALAKPPEKIVGGTYAAPGEFPHAVSFRRNGIHFCGGSIIDNQHILTAAHCIQGQMTYPYSDITVVSGTTSLSQGGNIHLIKRATTHPAFQLRTEVSFPNDIAVVTLSAPMTFDAFQAPVRLPTSSSYVGSSAILAGWGYLVAGGQVSENLQKLQTTIQDISACQQQWSGNPLYTNQICTVQSYGMGICSGDSGSGLLVGGEIVGVASFVKPCGVGYPDIYTNVATYYDFIKQELQQF